MGGVGDPLPSPGTRRLKRRAKAELVRWWPALCGVLRGRGASAPVVLHKLAYLAADVERWGNFT